MADTTTIPDFNPISREEMETRAAKIAEQQGFKDRYDIDAFRHAYTAAMMTKFHLGDVATGTLGYGVEFIGLWTRGAKDLFQSIMELFGTEHSESERVHYDEQFLESSMDAFNNAVGIAIGKEASSEQEIIKRITEKIHNGEIVRHPNEVKDRMRKEREISQQNFVANDTSCRAGNFDTSSLIRAISGGKNSRMSSKQIFSMSAAAFAQELIKSRRRSLENDLLELLSGGNGKNTLAQAGNGTPMASLTNTFGGMIDNLVGSAMNRRKTRTSTAESDRSIETSRNWNPSRSQQQAMLAGWAQQGNRNL
ncbi:MAG: hypothetical protein ACK502_02925 [Alphaproteobacteria bacterium]